MRFPNLYVNLAQTICMATIATALVCYIFDYRGFRTDVNMLVDGYSHGNRRNG